MTPARLERSETFDIQFVWKIPEGDYVRAIFTARVISHIQGSDRYLIELKTLKAGRQESPEGAIRSPAELSRDYWRLVGELIGRRAAVASEAADGRPLHMILRTLTREHRFFTQFDDFDFDGEGDASDPPELPEADSQAPVPGNELS